MKRSARTPILVLLLTFLLAFSLTIPAAAQGPVTGDTIPAGTVYDHDAILVGQQVRIDGRVNGNVFILGNQVTVNGTVDGSLILIGQNAAIGGEVTGGVYTAALTLDLAPQASIGKDLYAVIVSLTSGEQSLIGRDLYAVGLDSGLNGQVERDLHTVIGPIQLYNGLMTLLGYDNLTLKLRIDAPRPASGSSGWQPSPGRLSRVAIAPHAQAGGFDWGGWALNLLRTWGALFALGMLAIWLLRRPLESSAKALMGHPWRTIGSGLLGLVTIFLLFGAVLLVGVIVFALGLGLNYLGLWQLSLIFWIIVYTALALVLAAAWFFIVYGAKIVVLAALAGLASEGLLHHKGYWYRVLMLLAATVLFVLLRSVPYVGWIFDLLCVAAGLGAAWKAYRGWHLSRRVVPTAEAETPEPSVKVPAPRPRVRKPAIKAS